MHKARAGKMSDVIREAKFWSNITPKLRTGEFCGNVRVDAESRLRGIDGFGVFLKFFSEAYEAYEYKFSFRG